MIIKGKLKQKGNRNASQAVMVPLSSGAIIKDYGTCVFL